MRSDRSRSVRSVPEAVEDDRDDDVPDLRAKSPITPPLSNRVKEIAALIGALTAIGGYVLGGGRWALKQADIAKGADIAAAIAPLVQAQQAADRVQAERNKAFAARLDAIQAAQKEQAATLQSMGRTLRKLRPAAAKDLP